MLVLFACGVGFGILVLVGALILGIWWLARRDCSIVVGKSNAIRWHGDA